MRVIGEVANTRLVGSGYLWENGLGASLETPARFRESGRMSQSIPYYAIDGRGCNGLILGRN